MSSGEGAPKPADFVWATFAPTTDDTGAPLSKDDKKAQRVQVQFNPETLDIQLTNNFKQSSGKSPVQLVDEAKAQLSLELQYDTTQTGVDVRQDTGKIASFLAPLDKLVKSGRNEKRPPPRVVEFEWGAIAFEGYIDSYSETLEFFSADGVPLRAKISLSLTQQERSFEPRNRDNSNKDAEPEAYANKGVANDPFAGGFSEKPQDRKEPVDPGAGKANGVENPRFPEVPTLSLSASGKLGVGAAAFASAGAALGGGIGAGAGFAAGAGVGIGAGAGVGIGAGAGIGIGGGLSAGASAGVGFSAGAGVSVGGGSTAAAFSGLSVKPPEFKVKPIEIKPVPVVSTSTKGAVSLGGAVKAKSGGSLNAKVGGKISFGGE